MTSGNSPNRVLPGVDLSSSRPPVPRKRRRVLTIDEHVAGVLGCDRGVLGQTFSLLESTREKDQNTAQEVISRLQGHSGNSIRVGISGVPGVGKSTFIDVFGMKLIEAGHRVAVLAVDPSSEKAGGSILGDKTRMEELSRNENAIVRPSPSGETVGGVARGTRESILVCEAAGYDVILIETVGVGQSETVVSHLVDFFLLLMLANAGDELQGIKRGIMEMADAVAITKADGENRNAAKAAMAQYTSALRFIKPASENWEVPVLTCSAVTGDGVDKVWDTIRSHHEILSEQDEINSRRQEQNIYWLHESIREQLVWKFYFEEKLKEEISRNEGLVREGTESPFHAAKSLMNLYREINQAEIKSEEGELS